MKQKVLIILSVFFFLASCDDIIIENTPENVFEVFWRTMDENYVFFEEKGIDWDSIHRIYAPKARKARNDEDLKDIFRSIIPQFQDGHLWINPTNCFLITGVPSLWFINNNNVEKLTARGFEIVHSEWNLLILVHKTRRVVYFKLNTFNYRGSDISTHRPERLLNNLDFANGLIIDFSNNDGGQRSNTHNFVSAFFNGRKKVLYQQIKTGSGRNDFSDKTPIYLQGRAYVPDEVPLIILTSPGTFSASNMATYILTDLRNTTVIGMPTSGGGGSLREVILPNGWRFGFPFTRTFSPSGRNMEFLFEPDIQVEMPQGMTLGEFRNALLSALLDYLDGL